MALKHPSGPQTLERDLAPSPLFTLEGDIPRNRLPDHEMAPDVAY